MALSTISIIGPESTGKSDLAAALAKHYGCAWVREYAREYLSQHGVEYEFDDLLKIAWGQQAAMTKAAEEDPGPILIFDTDLLVVQVWSEFVYNKCDNYILSTIAKSRAGLTLLCDTDLPWTEDEMREYPRLKERRILFHHYKEMLTEQKAPWVIITGVGEERLKNAIKKIDEVFLTRK